MFNYQKNEIVALVKDNGFRSETLEKVLRLIYVLDFTFDNSKEEILEKRKEITAIIRRYMEINNYTLSDETKTKSYI